MPDFSVEDHGHFFLEFCKLEKELKGPDPQLETVFQMCQFEGISSIEMAWRGGITVGVWNVPTAEMIWQGLPLETALSLSEERICLWLTIKWAGIFTRRERRCVRTPEKMARYLKDLANWCVRRCFEIPETYDSYWNDVQEQVKFMGRYVALKYLEFLRRYCGLLQLSCPDIRADGGWSPVRTLGMLYADLNEKLEAAPSAKYRVDLAEYYAEATLVRVKQDLPNVNFFEMQVMLCEYRTGYEHAHQYPGRSLDEELEYGTKVHGAWPEFERTTMFYRARYETFQHEALGEENNWNAIRKPLGTCLREYGYLWTDLKYDWSGTIDLREPARRS